MAEQHDAVIMVQAELFVGLKMNENAVWCY